LLLPSLPWGCVFGHQCIAYVEGARIVKASTPKHGKKSTVILLPSLLFRGLPPKIEVGRYHSLIVDPSTLPPTLRVIAWTEDHEIMAIEHTKYPLFGVQFHPESVLTPHGKQILKNFLEVRPDGSPKNS